MNIEQKAKAYDEAIDKIADAVEAGTIEQGLAEWLFPELKESKDERIREALINGFKDYKGWDEEWFDGITVRDAIAWLEKQGNQKEQLINKACDVLVNCIEDFMLRRMELWSEECKKQTLENIRKKLEE